MKVSEKGRDLHIRKHHHANEKKNVNISYSLMLNYEIGKTASQCYFVLNF